MNADEILLAPLYETRQLGHLDAWKFYPATPEGLAAALADAETQSASGRPWEVSFTPTPFERDLRYTACNGRVEAAVAS